MTIREPLELKEPVTLIAAMVERDDALLIAADSGQVESPEGLRGEYKGKLRQHVRLPLAWGVAGQPTRGDEFSDWPREHDMPSDWPTARDEMAEHVAQLNGRQRELATLAGVKADSAELFTVLAAGWLGGVMDIVELDHHGNANSYMREKFHAVGSGKGGALIAYSTLRRVNGIEPLDKFLLATDVAANMMPMCAPPVQIWRVSPSGVNESVLP